MAIPVMEGRNFGLDILRCLSITSVVLAHSSDIFYDPLVKNLLFGLGIFDGVTVFFVLSGFLIGSQLVRILSAGASYTDMGHFLARRALKTLPGYYTILIVLSVCSFGHLQAHQIPVHEYVFFIQNFNKSHPYFFTEAWSLSVEEWFYLVVPVSFLLCIRIFRWNIHLSIISISLLILFISHLLRALYIYQNDVSSAMEMDALIRTKVLTRLDAPIFGVLGAYFYHQNQALFYKFRYLFLAGSVFCVLVVIGIIYSIANPGNLIETTMNHPFAKPGILLYFDLFPLSILFAIPFIYYLKTNISTLVKFVTAFSKLSYAIYLVHASLVLHTLVLPYLLPTYFQWAGSHMLKIGFVLYILLTIGLSTILYQLVELPFYRLKQRIGRKQPEVQTVSAKQFTP